MNVDKDTLDRAIRKLLVFLLLSLMILFLLDITLTTVVACKSNACVQVPLIKLLV